MIASRRGRIGNLLTYAAMLPLAAFFLAPVLWLASLALRTQAEIFLGAARFFPEAPTLANFVQVITDGGFRTYLWNSVKLSALGAAGAVAFAAPAAYAFSRMRFRGRPALMMAILSVQMVSGLVVLIPLYRYMDRLGLLETHLGAALLYTSGTTGRSKGAMLTQGNLLSNAEALVESWCFSAEDVLLHALPIFHSHGLFVATNVTLLAGGSLIFLPRFDAEAVLAQLPRATTMMGVPTFYTRLLDDPRFDRALTAHMRLFVSGSAPLLAETHRAFEARTGHRILERYGMTETSMNISNPYEGDRRAGTVGLPLPGVEARVCDPETRAALPAGEIGMLHVRGPNVFQGYWNMPEKTREELLEDGWFITGDLARIDPDGYVTIVGRGKDLIISGGYNIYPKEIEIFLDAQPGVKESAVVGAPHPDFGESVVAVLVPEAGAEIDLAALDAAARTELAGFKRPRHVAILDALPRNTMGKVQKADLRTRYAGVFQHKAG